MIADCRIYIILHFQALPASVETKITSMSDCDVSVILVGSLIICLRFKSLPSSVIALFSGQSLSKLQFKSPRIKIGLFIDNART